jgi:diguanylate cyclase (GGDEF)-like protein/PAS domain S-box-containing protein
MHPGEPATRPTALIVDDDPVMRMLETETLLQFGFAVREAADGEAALASLAESPPDLILLDVDMPGIDGFTACRRIRQSWDATEMPVVMVTGMDDVDSITQAYDSGANDFIAKPINWPILGHRARYVLRSAQAAQHLRELEEKQAAIVRAMPDAIFMMDRDGTFLDYKDGYGAKPVATPGELMGRRMAEILPGEAAEVIGRGIASALAGGELQSAHYQLPAEDGIRHYEARIAPSGANTVVAIVRDITPLRLNEERIRRLAYFDPLTGMPNRLHFLEHADRELLDARRGNRQLALLFLDLDGFKRINDTLGHGAGDFLLQCVAKRLKEKLRTGDIVVRPGRGEAAPHLARLGGDEFTIVLPDLDDATVAERVAERVLAVVNRPFQINGNAITITASIGIAVFPQDGNDAAALLKHADTAMYHAKDEGRNNWQMYRKTLTSKALARLSLEGDLRRGLEREELRVVYQPQVLAGDGTIVGMEALIRWQHPERGLVSPAEFIPVAEDSGLIVPIGNWVLRTACLQLRAWQRSGIQTPRVAVNLSARQVRAPDFVENILAILAETGLGADLLELELTESILIDPDAQRIEGLHGLHARGVHFSIDDFGTAYSSMAYVKRFPVGTLKIDQSFVQGLPHNANDAGIVTAILAMARSLQLDVIAEGVETTAQSAFLRQAQCPKLQGYLFSRPVAADAMERLLRQGCIRVGSMETVAA